MRFAAEIVSLRGVVVDRVTEIGGNLVPVEDRDPSIVHFRDDAQYDGLAGPWEFWTVIGESRSVTGRCRPGSDPGERFRRMQGQEGYDDAWEIAAAARLVRPATEEKILGWLNSHPGDARFAETCRIGSRSQRVVKTEDGFKLE
jgi:hypothetical protein